MSKEKIIITGAGGFIGSELINFFATKNYTVTALVRTLPEKKTENIIYVKYDLSGILDEEIFSGAAFLIHCAFIKNDIETNIEGTKKLLNTSRKFRLKKNIFISSFSAHAVAISKYGKQKFEIEKIFNSENDCVLRAGVVLGNGGLFKQMSEHIKNGKLIPIVDGGKQPLQTIHIDDLIVIIEKVLTENISGAFSVAESVPVLYKDFFREICKNYKIKPKFISVPFFILNWLIFLAEILKIRLPVNKENILGLKKIQFIDTKNDLKKLGVKILTYKESLKKMSA